MGKKADELQKKLDEANAEIERLNRKIIEKPQPKVEPWKEPFTNPWVYPYYSFTLPVTPKQVPYNDSDTFTIPVSRTIWHSASRQV
jgi:hypothetical protein